MVPISGKPEIDGRPRPSRRLSSLREGMFLRMRTKQALCNELASLVAAYARRLMMLLLDTFLLHHRVLLHDKAVLRERFGVLAEAAGHKPSADVGHAFTYPSVSHRSR